MISKWKILIVDDEEVVHRSLKFTLRDVSHNDKKCVLFHAYSAFEARKIISADQEIALVILDVMMEKDDAGLTFIEFLRDELNNNNTRVLLYTGQSGIAPKREVSDKYIIDGYLDKNSSDNDDCYAAVRLALKSYEQILELNKLSKKDDVTLLSEIAETYACILKDSEFRVEYEQFSEMVNSIFHLSQEVLASYALKDLKDNLKSGTTKMQRLSREEYTTLVSIRYVKLILNYTSIQAYESERDMIFDTILKAARSFADIRILPDAARASIKACLANCNCIGSDVMA